MAEKQSDQNIYSSNVPGFTDAFGKQIVDTTRNEADLASHYPYTPQRWRFYQGANDEANRIFLNYNTDPRYSHQRFDGSGAWDVHTITPNAGETLILESPEKFRYVVGYEAFVTQALTLNQSLQSGDRMRIGPFDGQDGYGTEFRGDLGDDRVEMFIMRAGSKVANQVVEVKDFIKSFTRFGHRFAWYNVGRLLFQQTFSRNGNQIKKTPDGLSIDEGRGPRQANLPIRFEITASASTTNLKAEFGSCAWQTFGNTKSRVRPKTAHVAGSISTTGTWVPILAVQKAGSLDLVNTKLLNPDIGNYNASGEFRVLVVAVSPSKTDASSFVTPVEQSEGNTAIEHTQAVTTFPDSTGSEVTSTGNPGGTQGGYREISVASNKQEVTASSGEDISRSMYGNDVQIFLAYAENTGDYRLTYTTLQDW